MATQKDSTKESKNNFSVICVEQPVSETKQEPSFFQRHKKKIFTLVAVTVGIGAGYTYHITSAK